MLFAGVLRQLERELDVVAAELDLRRAHYEVLLVLGAQPTLLRVGTLARILNCSTQWLWISLRELSERGLVRSKRCPEDGRARLLSLTAKGRRAEERLTGLVRRRFEGAFRGASAAERDAWRTITQRLGRKSSVLAQAAERAS